MSYDEVNKVGDRPIGVFDSGIGGLTVLREIWRALPNENTVYFGDSGRWPYGSKSHETIVRYALENMRFLESQDVKMIVIACNSASAHAYEALCTHSSVPVVEVIFPGAEQAVKSTKNGQIGVIATRATVSSGIYAQAIEQIVDLMKEKPALGLDQNIDVKEVACPLFVSLAEEGWWNKSVTRLIAEEYLHPLKEKGTDVLVLGCTHYPLLTEVISDVMGYRVQLVNSGASVAQKVRRTLEANGMQNNKKSALNHKFYTSDDPQMFEALASPFLGGGRPSGTQHITTDSYRWEDDTYGCIHSN